MLLLFAIDAIMAKLFELALAAAALAALFCMLAEAALALAVLAPLAWIAELATVWVESRGVYTILRIWSRDDGPSAPVTFGIWICGWRSGFFSLPHLLEASMLVIEDVEFF